MYWACFLHFYQPPTQKEYWVKRITEEAYRRIAKELKNAPQAKLTLNISASLLELWDKFGLKDVIEDYKNLVKRGQVELTGSAAYHPLLPRLPESEIVRQIKLSEEITKRFFGETCKLLGFFPPEMAYDRKIARIVAKLGYEWIIAEELSFKPKFNVVDYSKIYEVSGIYVAPSELATPTSGPPEPARRSLDEGGRSSFQQDSSVVDKRLKIYFRQRDISYKILSGQIGTANLFLRELGERITQNCYLLTAMDGETFGHHRPGMEKLLAELFKTPKIKMVKISKLPEFFTKREVVKTRPSTWALMEKDIEKNVPFARWDDPGNKIHALQWQLTNLATQAVRESRYSIQGYKDIEIQGGIQGEKSRDIVISSPERKRGAIHPYIEGKTLTSDQRQWLKARELLDQALHSDQYWWASARPWWSLEMVERGAKELKEVIFAVPSVSSSIKHQASSLYYDIITTGFDWQREGIVDELARKEDEEIRMRTDEGLPKLPKKELEKIISNLKREMLEVAKNQEYERAAQLRDRIRELKEYL